MSENNKSSGSKVSKAEIVIDVYMVQCMVPNAQVSTVVLKKGAVKHGHFSFMRGVDTIYLVKYICARAPSDCKTCLHVPLCAKDGPVSAILNHHEHNHSASPTEFNDEGVSIHLISLAHAMQTLIDGEVRLDFQREIGVKQNRNKSNDVKAAVGLFNKALKLNKQFEGKFTNKKGPCTVYSYSRIGVGSGMSFVAKADGTIYIGFRGDSLTKRIQEGRESTSWLFNLVRTANAKVDFTIPACSIQENLSKPKAKITEAAIQELFIDGNKAVVNKQNEVYPMKYRFETAEENRLNASFILLRGQYNANSWDSADFRPKTNGRELDEETFEDWKIQIDAKETAAENETLKRQLKQMESELFQSNAKASKYRRILVDRNIELSDSSDEEPGFDL